MSQACCNNSCGQPGIFLPIVTYPGCGNGSGEGISKEELEKSLAELDAKWQQKLEGISGGTGYNLVPDGPEVKAGYYWNGKPVYLKQISIGGMPGNSVKTVPTNISDVELMRIHSQESWCLGRSGTGSAGITVTLPAPHSYTNYSVLVDIRDKTKIYVSTKTTDWADYNAWICLAYTKTTDQPIS